LHDAAVVGRVFWTGAVAVLAGRERDEVRRDLNELARREFVRPVRVSSIEGEDELSFWHALVRDVAYQQIPRAPRAEKHVAAARWVEEVAGERLDDHAGILVHHYGEAFALTRAAGAPAEDVEERPGGPGGTSRWRWARRVLGRRGARRRWAGWDRSCPCGGRARRR